MTAIILNCGTDLVRLTDDDHFNGVPVWSADGSRILYQRRSSTAYDEGNWDIVDIPAADGSDQRRITDGPGRASAPAWSPRGGRIAYVRSLNEPGARAGRGPPPPRHVDGERWRRAAPPP